MIRLVIDSRLSEIGRAMDEAIATYAHEVQERRFPAVEHTYAGQAKSKG